MREKTIRSHVRLAWILLMTTPYQHNPDSSAPQVMSPSITLGGQTGSGMAAQGPNYGGVDTGGAGGPAPEGGQAWNRTMAEGQSLSNGVIGSQNPIAPGGRAVTTGSEVLEQPRGSGQPLPSSSMTSSRPMVHPAAGSGATNLAQAHVRRRPLGQLRRQPDRARRTLHSGWRRPLGQLRRQPDRTRTYGGFRVRLWGSVAGKASNSPSQHLQLNLSSTALVLLLNSRQQHLARLHQHSSSSLYLEPSRNFFLRQRPLRHQRSTSWRVAMMEEPICHRIRMLWLLFMPEPRGF